MLTFVSVNFRQRWLSSALTFVIVDFDQLWLPESNWIAADLQTPPWLLGLQAWAPVETLHLKKTQTDSLQCVNLEKLELWLAGLHLQKHKQSQTPSMELQRVKLENQVKTAS